MAQIQAYYDVGKAPEIDSMKRGLGNYLSTRIKANREQLKRKLKAADPSNALELLKQEQTALRDLEKQYSSLTAKPSGGDSISRSWSAPDPAKKFRAKQDIIKQQTREADNFSESMDSASRRANRIQKRIINEAAGIDAESKEGIRAIAQKVNQQLGKFMEDRSDHKSQAGKHAFGQQVLAQSRGLPKRTQEVIKASLRANKALPDESDLAMYADPTIISERLQADLEMFDRGTSSSRTTRKQMGAGVDPQQMAKLLEKRIQEQRARVKAAYQRYDAQVAEFKSLSAGPDYNIALAPIGRRPTALTSAMGMYGELREKDPRFARDILESSREEGRLVVPDRYTGISTGKSPIDSLLDTTDNLATLRGRKFEAPGPGEYGTKTPYTEPREFDAKDVVAVKDALRSMSRTVGSPLFANQKYGQINSQGKMMDMKEYLSSGIQLIEELEAEDPQMAAQAAQDLSDELIDWRERESQDQEMISLAREEGDPRQVLSDSVNVVKGALRDYEVTGDNEQFSAILNDQRNSLLDTSSENIGDAGAEYNKILENFAKTGDTAYFENQLTDLQIATQEPYFEGV